MEKIYEELHKEQFNERKDEVVAGLNAEYSKNHTISGFLNNIYNHCSQEYSEDIFYQYFKRKKESGSWKKEYDRIVLYSNSNILYKDNLTTSIYRQLINSHPYYGDVDFCDRIHNTREKLCKEVEHPEFVPHFTTNDSFYYAYYLSNNSRYNEESKKVYLDIGQENFDLLFDDIFKLYVEFRKKVDRDIDDVRKTRTNQFKVRTGYANDGIVFRLFSDEQYQIFRETLSSNESILKYLRSSNPFLPIEEINGHPYNILPDSGDSYNEYITHICELYILNCIKEGKSADIKDFLKYLKESTVLMEKVNPVLGDQCTMQYKNIAIEQVEKELTKTRN